MAKLTLILLLFGVVMVGNASFADAASDFGNKWYYLRLQAVWSVIGLVGMYLTSKINLKRFPELSFYFLLSNIFLLLIVLIPGIGIKLLGARRWLGFGSLTFQPAELIKLAMILYLPKLLIDRNFKIVIFLGLLGLVCGLVALEPDMGTAMITFFVGMSIYFASGKPLKPLALLTPILGLIFTLFIVLSPYRLERLKTFLDYSHDPMGSSYHIRQALLGIGSGGIWGAGFGQSKQKYQFLPEVTTDSIFAVVAEEMGFVGATALILAFLYLIHQGLEIAKNTNDEYLSLVAVGITSWIGWQAVINIAAMTALVPLTGIPLPFISYGGSSLVVLLSAVGLLINIAKKK